MRSGTLADRQDPPQGIGSDVDNKTPRTISEVVDGLERIQQDLFRLQKAEKMEKADAASRASEKS